MGYLLPRVWCRLGRWRGRSWGARWLRLSACLDVDGLAGAADGKRACIHASLAAEKDQPRGNNDSDDQATQKCAGQGNSITRTRRVLTYRSSGEFGTWFLHLAHPAHCALKLRLALVMGWRGPGGRVTPDRRLRQSCA